jgi:hypothetical protein
MNPPLPAGMPVARFRTAFSHLDRRENPCFPRRFAECFDILAKGWSQNAAASRISAPALGGNEPISTNAARCRNVGFWFLAKLGPMFS